MLEDARRQGNLKLRVWMICWDLVHYFSIIWINISSRLSRIAGSYQVIVCESEVNDVFRTGDNVCNLEIWPEYSKVDAIILQKSADFVVNWRSTVAVVCWKDRQKSVCCRKGSNMMTMKLNIFHSTLHKFNNIYRFLRNCTSSWYNLRA